MARNTVLWQCELEGNTILHLFVIAIISKAHAHSGIKVGAAWKRKISYAKAFFYQYGIDNHLNYRCSALCYSKDSSVHPLQSWGSAQWNEITS